MPKVVLFIATSRGGYIVGPDGTVDGLNSDLGLNIQMNDTQDIEF